MAEKILNTRIQLKYDTWDKWDSDAGKAVVLKKGEIGICEIPAKTGEVAAEPAIIFKVGDGTTAFSALPWASAKAADVHTWAKQSEQEFVKNFLSLVDSEGKALQEKLEGHFATVTELNAVKEVIADGVGVMSVVGAVDGAITIGGTASAPTVGVKLNATQGNVTLTTTGGLKASIDADNLKVGSANTADSATVATSVANALTLQAGTKTVTFDGSQAATVNITAADLGLSGAMHFLGTSLTPITDGGDEEPKIDGEVKELTDIALGSVVLYDNKEFVLTGLGTAKKWELLGDEGSYALKEVSITGDEEHGLTGGGTLTEDRKIGIKDGGVTTDKIADANVTGAKIANKAIAQDHLTDDLAEWIKKQAAAEVSGLATIAKTGNVLNLEQTEGDVLVFYCGNATELVTQGTVTYRITIRDRSTDLLSRIAYTADVQTLGTWNDLINAKTEFKCGVKTFTLVKDGDYVKTSTGLYICLENQNMYPGMDARVAASGAISEGTIYETEFIAGS